MDEGEIGERYTAALHGAAVGGHVMNIQCTTNARDTYPREVDAKIDLMTGLAVNFSMGAERFSAVQQAVVKFRP